MTYHEEQIYDEFWQAIKAQAKSVDKKVFKVSDSVIDKKPTIAVTSTRPKTTSARAKRIEVMPLARNATGIEVRGDIDMDFEFVLDDADLITGLKHGGKTLTPSEAAEKILELLFHASSRM